MNNEAINKLGSVFGDNLKNAAKKFISNQNNVIYISVIVFCLILFLIILAYVWTKINLEENNCHRMDNLYSKFPLGWSSLDTKDNCHRLRDYYVKTAYNCCSAGNYKNDFVNLCALKNCITQGVRCLDFEIYSVDNEPVIAVSDINSYNTKGSYNSIPFSDALNIIEKHAFSASYCPNPDDPLIIYLRIMSKNNNIYTEMAKNIYDTLERRVLGKKYSYENNGHNLGNEPIKNLMEKVIFIADKSNALFEKTPLDEYINLASNSAFMRSYRYNQIRNVNSIDDIVDYNKKNMTITLPDLGSSSNNPSPMLPMKFGCQFIALSMQNFDVNLEAYINIFDEQGSAFVLKPENLRFVPVTINVPPEQKEDLSYAKRLLDLGYGITYPY